MLCTRSRLITIVVTATLLGSASTGLAAPTTVPTGLNPGDPYRLAFVTSTIRDASSTNIADYNAHVTAAANAVPELLALGATWTAIASTATVDARDNTSTNPGAAVGVPIYLLDDTLLVNDNADLWDSSIAVALNIFEDGTVAFPPTTGIWTGSDVTGIGFVTLELGGVTPRFGSSTFTDARWIDRGLANQGTAVSFYAISSTLTVGEVQAPALAPALGPASLLVMAGLFGLVGYLGSRRRSAARLASPRNRFQPLG